MPDNDNGSRKPRSGTRKASASADDRPAATAEATSAEPGRQRIARAMARAGLCSRRDAEAWILDGRVCVNGDVLTSPARDVGPDDRVEVDGQPLPEAEKTRLFLFHKPRGLVTSDHDPEGRHTVTDYLRENWPSGPRVVTIGRLDINTEGLLLLTNDGGLARQLELPKTGWLRRYRVRANGETDQAKLDALADGISIEGVDYAGIEAKLDRVQGANCWLTMGLREGKNREIKRVLEHLGLEVNRLIRLSFGPFQLLDLEEGAVEEVRTRVLKDQLGVALAAEAGVDFGEAPAPDPTMKAPNVVETAKPVKPANKTGKLGPISPKTRSRVQGERSDRAPARSGGERLLRRSTAAAAEAPARDERSEGRPRRHVSALRSARADDERSGPRKRIERSDTRDRKDRTVAVERKVSTRLSPSAEGKRARIARSGGQRRQDGETARPDDARAPSRPRPNRSSPRADRREGSYGADTPARSGADRGDRERAPRRDDRRGASSGKPRTSDRSPTRDTGDGRRGEGRVARSGDRPPAKAATSRGRPPGRGDKWGGGKSSGGASPGRSDGGRPPGRSGSGPAASRSPSGSRPPDGRPSSGRPGSGRPSSGRPSGGRPGGSKPGGGKPGGGRPSGSGGPGRGKR